MKNYEFYNDKLLVAFSISVYQLWLFIIVYFTCALYGSFITIESMDLDPYNDVFIKNTELGIGHTKDAVETVVDNSTVYTDVDNTTKSDVTGTDTDSWAKEVMLERRGILMDFVDWVKSFFKGNDNVTNCQVPNQETIILQPEIHGNLYCDNVMRDLSADEITKINIIAHNYGAFEYNNLLLDSNNPEVVQEIFDFIQSMYNTDPSDVGSHSELSSDLVRNIQNGGSLTIYTSDSGSTLEHIYEQYQNSSVDGSSVVNLPVDSHTFSNESTNPAHVGVETSITTLNSLFDNITNNPHKVVIAVKPAGSGPSPLPSWTEVTTPPSLDSPERSGWERNVGIIKYWTSKFEWMGDGFKSVTIDQQTTEWIRNVGGNLPDIEHTESYTPLPDQTEAEISDLNTPQHIDREASIKNDKDSLETLERSQTIVRPSERSNDDT